MRIELASLEGTDGQFSHVYEPGQLVFEDERVHQTEPLMATGRIVRAKRGIKVNGRINTRAEIECDRCLTFIQLPVDAGLNLEYVTPEDYEKIHAAELSEEDMALSIFDGGAIDLDELVSEQLLLALPLRILCEPNCKGLCPVCGANRNVLDCSCEVHEVDPRWDALKELAKGK